MVHSVDNNELQECGGQAKEGQAEERILQRLGGTKRRFANQEVLTWQINRAY